MLRQVAKTGCIHSFRGSPLFSNHNQYAVYVSGKRASLLPCRKEPVHIGSVCDDNKRGIPDRRFRNELKKRKFRHRNSIAYIRFFLFGLCFFRIGKGFVYDSGRLYSPYRKNDGSVKNLFGLPWPFSHSWLVFRKQS